MVGTALRPLSHLTAWLVWHAMRVSLVAEELPTGCRCPGEAPHDLDLLLRHRLLPQADGFEGLAVGLVHRCPGHHAVAQFPDKCNVRDSVNFEPARSTSSSHVVPHDDLAARRDSKVDRRELEAFERLRDGAYVASPCVSAVVDA